MYVQGKRPRYLFYLLKGKVKAYRTHEDGKEYITNLYNEGEFIGYVALLEDKPYDESASFLEDADVIQIPKEDFLKMVYGDISIASKFIYIITQNVKEKEEKASKLSIQFFTKACSKGTNRYRYKV